MTDADAILIGQGFSYDDLSIGFRFRTTRRTVTEADLVAFINLTWLNEELFTNAADRSTMAIAGRVVPGALIYAMAEGLLTPAMQGTGLAFLNMDLDVRGPTFVGDTIRVDAEVVEMRPSSKSGRGLVRTVNTVTKQSGETVLVYRPLRLLRRRNVQEA